MSKILITGASGNIGAPLVQALQAQAADFAVMRSRPSADAGTRTASFADVQALQTAFRGVDTLFVLLPLVPDKLQLAQNVATAARQAGVRHIVRSSGAGADAAAPFALPRLQGTIDRVFEDTGIATTFLRPAGFMQNYAGFMAPMVRQGTIYGATANAAQSLIDVRDIAAVAAHVLLNPAPHAGKAYTLTGAESLTDAQRAEIFSSVLGRDIRFVEVSREAARASMVGMGLPEAVTAWLDSLNELVSAGYAGAISPDVPRLLGRAPVDFRRFVTDFKGLWS